MIKGNKIHLTKVERENIEQLRKWRNNPELRRYFREHRELNKDNQINWYENKVLGDSNQYNFEVRTNIDNKLIGHCGLYYINWISRTAEFGIYIGDMDYREGGYGSDTLRTLIGYGFNDLNMNRIWCEVWDNNAALDVYKHIGFVYEGKLRQTYFNEGKYWDSHLLGMLQSEYNEKYK
jgi:UDP-4-amino-4,6-dideoxy-N-acetyl-beta-L-altrosamine N-acetyltransferase